MSWLQEFVLGELNDQVALVADPSGGAAVLDKMAYAARRRPEVDNGDLVDMLEIVELARLWAFDESERVGVGRQNAGVGWLWLSKTAQEHLGFKGRKASELPEPY